MIKIHERRPKFIGPLLVWWRAKLINMRYHLKKLKALFNKTVWKWLLHLRIAFFWVCLICGALGLNYDEVSFPRISFLGKMTGTSSGCFIYLYSSLVFPEFFFFFFNFFILLIILFLCQGPLHSSKLSNTFLPIIYIKKYKHTYIYIYIFV